MKMVGKIVDRGRELGLSQAAIERACALSENRISKWANGQGEPTARQLHRIARLLGCTADYLVDDALADPSAGATLGPAAQTAAKMAEAYGMSEADVMRALGPYAPSRRDAPPDPPTVAAPEPTPPPGTGRGKRSA